MNRWKYTSDATLISAGIRFRESVVADIRKDMALSLDAIAGVLLNAPPLLQQWLLVRSVQRIHEACVWF